MREFRVARLQIAPQLFAMITKGIYKVVQNEIPDDARIVQITVDPTSGMVNLFLESVVFEEVPVGGIPPVLDSPVVVRLVPVEPDEVTVIDPGPQRRRIKLIEAK